MLSIPFPAESPVLFPLAMNMPTTFIAVVLIWATTPLAIKWSGEGSTALFGIASRMVIGVAVCLILLFIVGGRLQRHRDAMMTYLAAGLGVWSTMTCVYWAVQFLPSGLIAVIFGLTPVVTGVLAALILGEKVLTLFKIGGMLLGVGGLAMIFYESLLVESIAVSGLLVMLIAVFTHATSAVWVKYIGADIGGLETATGSLVVSSPLYVITWWTFEGVWPEQITQQALWSIIYLAVVGSAIGFMLYFRLLRRWPANRTALITLVTPVLALGIGWWANGEVIDANGWIGALVILLGLVSYEYGDAFVTRRIAAPENADI